MDNNNFFDKYLIELKESKYILETRLSDISYDDEPSLFQTESLLKIIEREIAEYESYEKF